MLLTGILFSIICVFFTPLIGSLFYVWWKYGKEEELVKVARGIYSVGVVFLVGYMVTILLAS